MFNFLDELKCQHEYKYIGSDYGTNGFGIETERKYYQCEKCLKEKFEDILINGW